MPKPTIPPIPVIIDTQVFTYLSDSNKTAEVVSFFNEVTSANYSLNYSDITTYEVMKSVTRKNEERALNLLNTFGLFPVRTEELKAAARLEVLYRMEKINTDRISLADCIIAATSILSNAPIITVNHKDYPRPYFIELHSRRLSYVINDVRTTDVIFLLSPNLDVLLNRFNQRS